MFCYDSEAYTNGVGLCERCADEAIAARMWSRDWVDNYIKDHSNDLEVLMPYTPA